MLIWGFQKVISNLLCTSISLQLCWIISVLTFSCKKYEQCKDLLDVLWKFANAINKGISTVKTNSWKEYLKLSIKFPLIQPCHAGLLINLPFSLFCFYHEVVLQSQNSGNAILILILSKKLILLNIFFNLLVYFL